ncbi:hypothetical protein ACFP1Z_01340 [Streptomyces gamaensis]|uniref:Lipoprotein n=1 Tax=Streptomyces gamaensis TaxID=1763542 RepID=A0ABW0YTL1_9ACTN
MRIPKAALTGAVCLGLAAVLTACGSGEDPDAGTNGVGRLSAAAIQTKAREAARSARTVHLSGNVVSQGRTYRLDMRLKDNGGTGSVASDATTFELLRVGDQMYVKAGAGFWSAGGGPAPAAGGAGKGEKSRGDSTAAAAKLADKYVKVHSGDPSYQQFRGFTDKNVLLDGLLGLHGALTRGEHGTVGGARTIRVSGAGGAGDAGTLDVSLKGEPYPLRVQRAGGAGQLELTDWGKDFALDVPPKEQTVDYGTRVPGVTPSPSATPDKPGGGAGSAIGNGG